MGPTPGNKNPTPDDSVLPTIWILSCLDHYPFIRYEGIQHRIGLSAKEVKGLVRSRRDLFHSSIPENRVNAWKDEMKKGNCLPNSIKRIEDEAKRNEAIDDISTEKIFRNQFRIEFNAPKSEIAIIDWGLKHIEILRKAGAEKREARHRFLATIVVPVISLILVTLVSLVSLLVKLH
jgi:hypothetical protein